MKLQKVLGSTGEIWQVFIRDSSSTTGGGLTGLTNASGSLTAYYHRDTDTTATVINLVTMTVGTFTSSGFKEIDATNLPGWYQFCPPNAALASGAKSVAIHLKGATNMAPLPIEVQLIAVNIDDSVRMGMTALPNAAAEAAGGLFTRGTGAGQINQDANGRVDVNGKAWAGGAIPAPNVTGVPLVDDKYLLGTIYSTPATAGVQDINLKNVANVAVSTTVAQIGTNAVNIGGTAQTGRDIGASVLLSAGTGTGQLDFTTGVVKANLAQILGTALTETAGQIAAGFKKFFNIAAPAATMDHGVLVDTVTTATTASALTTNNDKSGYSLTQAFPANFAALGISVGGHVSNVDTLTTYTGDTPQTGDSFARIGAAGAGLTAIGDTRVAHLDADVSSRASPTNITAGTITTVTNLTNAPTSGDLTATMKTSVTTAATAATPTAAAVTGAVGSVTGNVGGNVTGSVGSVAGSVGSVTGLTASNLDVAVSTRLASSSYTAPPSAATIAQAVWDALTSALTTIGSVGKLIVTNIDAAISSRSSYAGGDTAGTTTLLARPSPLDAAATRTAIGLASANLDTQIGTLATGTEITSLQSHGDGAWSTATGFSTLDAGAVENAVWDATAASHVTSGSFGAAVDTLLSEVGTIEGRIGTPAFGDLAGDIAHAQGVVDGINGVTSTLVLTAGKLWVLDENGNPLPHTTDISTIEAAIGALPASSDNAAAVLAATYEGAETVQDHFRLARAALYGKANGLAGTTVHYRDAADAKNRLTATVDGDGNRTAVTADAS